MSEQQSRTTATTAPKSDYMWGDPISEKRQAELRGYLGTWDSEPDDSARKSPFDKQPGERSGVKLSGADVYWLVEHMNEMATLTGSIHIRIPVLHIEGADLNWAHLEGAYLKGAYLERADLNYAHLEGAN